MKRLINISALLATIFISQYSHALPDDMTKPLEVQADEASFDQNTGEAIYKGNVLIKQGSIEIQALSIKISTNPETRQFSSLVANGNPAKFSQKIDQNGNIVIGKGDKIHYSTSNPELEIIGNGSLSRMNNSISADHIIYMIQDGAFSAEKKGEGRVSMTLQPQAVKATK